MAIGASAGGLKALTDLFQHLPPDTGMGFVIVQHLSPSHESMMASILSRSTKMKISEITDGMRVLPNHVYVMSEKGCISLSEGTLRTHPDLEEHCVRMPIDYFFQSLANDWRSKAIAVILSGSASDGSLGLADIKETGGITFAQDLDSAEFDSMPRSAISTGHVDFVCSPKDIAEKLIAISRHPYSHDQEKESDESLRQILKLLQKISSINFTNYKIPTIRRRVVRRMVLSKLESLKDYVMLLEKNKEEVQALLEDVLIQVTQFFRDPQMFELLKRRVFPELIAKREEGIPIRIWVAVARPERKLIPWPSLSLSF